jgi:hypothetical protein
MARHFPMAQLFNDDPETWELTDEFGDRALRLAIEVFSILDRNGNQWKLVERWEFVLGKKLRMSPGKCSRIVGWMLAKHWLIVGQVLANGRPSILQACNYWKYHKRHEPQRAPPNLTEPNLRVSSHKNAQRPASPVVKNPEKKSREERHMTSMNLIPELKKETDRLYYSDPVKFKKLAKWVAESRKNKFLETDMAEALREFWDYRAVTEWYEYLDSILIRIDKDRNRDESLAEHEHFKNEPIAKTMLELVKGLTHGKTGK